MSAFSLNGIVKECWKYHFIDNQNHPNEDGGPLVHLRNIKNINYEKATFHHETVASYYMGQTISMFGVHLQWLNPSKQCIHEYGMRQIAERCPNIR
jgi:hypothetical protein